MKFRYNDTLSWWYIVSYMWRDISFHLSDHLIWESVLWCWKVHYKMLYCVVSTVNRKTRIPIFYCCYSENWYMRYTLLLVHLDQRSRWTIAITWRPSSVVCKLFTFQASSPKPLCRLEPNLAGMFLGWSSTKLPFFVPVGYQYGCQGQ
jgi:hypothetical protein